MNVLTKIRHVNELNDKELLMGIVGKSSSWHNQYKDSAWIYVGNMSYELTEGDIICVFSQYGEIVNINLIRDKKTGKSKGFGFLCYEDQRSTILAVDNLNGSKVKGRQLRVDHVQAYKVPKENDDIDELTGKIYEHGVAPAVMDEVYKCNVKAKPNSVPKDYVKVKDEILSESSDRKRKHKKTKKSKKKLKSD